MRWNVGITTATVYYALQIALGDIEEVVSKSDKASEMTLASSCNTKLLWNA